MKALFLLSTATALLALSACGKSDEKAAGAGTNMSASQVAEKINDIKLQPGEWEATQEIVDVKMTGAPKGVSPDIVKAMLGRKTSVKHCITPEQAANPNADFLAAQKDVKCAYSKMDMSGGKIAGAMSCAAPGQQKSGMKMAMTGTYLPDHYAIDMQVETAGMNDGMGMIMKMKSAGKRIGDCPAGEEEGG
jgi:hypothetical protein